MTYTILLNGGKEMEVQHDSTTEQLMSLIKSWQSQAKWVQFITTGGDYWLDSLAIQGFKPHGGSTAMFGEPAEKPKPPMASATGQPPTGQPPKKRKA